MNKRNKINQSSIENRWEVLELLDTYLTEESQVNFIQ